jgi:hypothetical protein
MQAANPLRIARRPSIQAPIRDPANDAYARKYSCATCKVTYELPRGMRAQCPLCKAVAEVDQLRQALLEAKNKLELRTNELTKLRPQVDLVIAMRSALDLLGPDDRMFLKSVAYRHRAGESITLQVVTIQRHSFRGRVKRVPSGFVAAFQSAPETHMCTSMGGLALAQYVSEDLATVGPVTTVQHLMRAMSAHLVPQGMS